MDLASLGLRIESQEVDTADKRLDDFAAAATRAESSVDGLANAARRADGATQTMNVAVAEQTRMLSVTRNAMGLTASEGLNMGRQMSDVFVQAAMGTNLLMIGVMQGPQIFDIFQQSAIRAGTSVRAAMVATGAAVWAALAPLIPVIAGIAVVAGTVAAAWGLSTRAMTKDIGDLTTGMNLNEAQLKRLKDQNVSTTATAGDAWRGLGTTIKEMFASVFGDELKWVDKQWNSFLDEATRMGGAAVDFVAGAFVGAYRVVVNTWKLLPAAVGDAAISAANASIDALNGLIQGSLDGINRLRQSYNSLPEWMRGGQEAPEARAGLIGRMDNPYQGAMGRMGAASAAAMRSGFADMDGASGRFMGAWRGNTRDSGEARLTGKAGDAGDGDAERAARAARGPVVTGLEKGDFALDENIIRLVTKMRDPAKDLAFELRLIDDLARSAGQGMADSFGTAGAAAGRMLETLTNYKATLQAIATDESLNPAQKARESANLQMQAYGDVAGAAKGFFAEGSEGYRALQAAEAAYRVFSFAMSVQAMAQDAAVTASSVANSGVRASASTASGAARMFEMLGPFAFPVVGAMLALLASIGLKGGGGGGSGGGPRAANDNGLSDSVTRSQGQSAQQDQSRQSIFESVAQKIEVKVTADRDGLNAYVTQTAEDVARPMVNSGMAATAGATRAQVMADIGKGRTYNRTGG